MNDASGFNTIIDGLSTPEDEAEAHALIARLGDWTDANVLTPEQRDDLIRLCRELPDKLVVKLWENLVSDGSGYIGPRSGLQDANLCQYNGELTDLVILACARHNAPPGQFGFLSILGTFARGLTDDEYRDLFRRIGDWSYANTFSPGDIELLVTSLRTCVPPELTLELWPILVDRDGAREENLRQYEPTLTDYIVECVNAPAMVEEYERTRALRERPGLDDDEPPDGQWTAIVQELVVSEECDP